MESLTHPPPPETCLVRNKFHRSRILATQLAITLLLCGSIVPAVAQSKKTITKADDLPRLTYKVEGTATELVTDAAKFDPFARQVRADIERILADYSIEDKATLKRFKGALLSLDLLAGGDDAALKLIRELRELEDDPAAKMLTGLFDESRIAAARRVENPKQNADALKRAFQELFTARIKNLPWEVVRSALKSTKAGLESLSENYYLGIIQSLVEPTLKEEGTVSRDVALELIDMRSSIQLRLPFKEERLAALRTVITSHNAKQADIWPARDWTLGADRMLAPVVVAIWGSGVDLDIFKDQQFINAREQLNGRDDDRNGFIDDVHGIAYDLECNKSPHLMYPLGGARDRLPAMKNRIKGQLDWQAGIDSPEAGELKRIVSNLKPDEFKSFIEDLNLFSNHTHGTHVAGIAVAGNPFARVLSARLPSDHRMPPPAPSVEQMRKEAKMFAETVDYFKASQVRVVLMTWFESRKDKEAALEANGVEKDGAKRAELAREIFEVERHGLYNAFRSAPEILFICSAGLGGPEGQSQELIPSSFQLPNMIVAGTVDQAGDGTAITRFGGNVDVYANGIEVDTYFPGGDRVRCSDTFMAAAGVANLAAKLFAVKPSLKPHEVIALIKLGVEKGGSANLPLIHPRKTGELVTK